MRIFVLGANDPEMREIVRVLDEAGERYVFARHRGANVRAVSAYKADGTSAPIVKDAQLVFVECEVMGLRASVVVDHHRPGDPGFECGPDQYLEGSALGQVLSLLGRVPTDQQRIICAADHCPDGAYKGLCPGVDVEAFANWRLASKAAVKGVPLEEMQELVKAQHAQLLAAERIDVAGTSVAWMPESTDETPDASARYQIPFMYRTLERDGREKFGILGAPPSAITAWMEQCGLDNVYGCPDRGYAGGYRAAAI